MIVYMTQGQKTVLSRITVEGLPLHYLSVGRGYFARRRALRCLRQLYDSGVRRCICADVYLLSLAKQVDITSYPVLPLRLALLGSLLDILCPGGLQNAAAVLRCGPGGEETARAALTVLARRARYVQLDMEDPAALAAELLYRWGIAAGDGGRRAALTVVCGDVREDTEGPAIYLTEDCGARQTPVWTSPRAAALAAELLYRWGIAAGDGGRRAALTVVCGDVREDTEGPAIYLTEDCGARQTPVWTSPRAAALAVPVTESLAAVLTAAGKWQISDIHITDLLDIRTESHYNAT